MEKNTKSKQFEISKIKMVVVKTWGLMQSVKIAINIKLTIFSLQRLQCSICNSLNTIAVIAITDAVAGDVLL